MPGSSRAYSIRIRLMSVTGLIWITIIALATAGASFFTWRTETESWRGRQGEAARRNAAAVAAFYGQAQDMLAILSRFAEAQQAGAIPTGGFVDLARDYPPMQEVLLLDQDGRILANAYQDKPILADLFTIAQSRWFQEARNGKPYRGDLQLSHSELPYLVLARPTQAGNVVAARLSMDVLHAMVADIRFGGTGRLYVVDDLGQVIAHTDHNAVLSNASIQDRPEFTAARILQGGEWFGEYINFEGASVVGATATVPGTDWIVLTEVDVSEAYAASRGSVIFLGAGMFVLVFTVALLHTRIVRRTLFDPIERLRVSAENIGQGDLAFRTGIADRNEVGIVARAFDEMAQKLQEQHEARSSSATPSWKRFGKWV